MYLERCATKVQWLRLYLFNLAPYENFYQDSKNQRDADLKLMQQRIVLHLAKSTFKRIYWIVLRLIITDNDILFVDARSGE